MLTKEDTSADEFGITDADVAEWDAEVAEYLAFRKANPDYVPRSVDEVMDELRKELHRKRAVRIKHNE
jgi:hypothetical protein